MSITLPSLGLRADVRADVPADGRSASVRFAQLVRVLSEAARLQQLDVPIFCARPPGRGAPRAIQRSRRGATVSIVVRDRRWHEVVNDCIDGVVAANGLEGAASTRCRTALRAALGARHDDVV